MSVLTAVFGSSSSLSVAKALFATQIALAVSYLLFSSSHRAFRARARAEHWLSLGKILLIVSIVAPAPFFLLTPRFAETFVSTAHDPFPESDAGGGKRETARNVDPHPYPRPAVARKRDAGSLAGAIESLRSWIGESGATAFLAFLILGGAFGTARFVQRVLRLSRTLRNYTVQHSIGKTRVVLSHDGPVPYSAWIGGANWVVLPLTLFGGDRILDGKGDRAYSLKHEIEHHRRGDTRWAFFLEMGIALFAFYPFAYYWKKKLEALLEFACDESLVRRRDVVPNAYARCLLRTAERALRYRSAGIVPLPATLGMAAPAELSERVSALLTPTRVSKRWFAPLVGAIAATVTVAGAAEVESLLRADPAIPNPGAVIVDLAIQTIADRALSDAVRELNARGGFAIVAEPDSGRILAVASIDTSGKLDPNWALNQMLEPASLAKALVAAQAIESGVTRPNERLDCENGEYRYGGRTYHDWRTQGWDHLTTTRTIALSSDICSMKIGEKIGASGLYRMLENFGVGPGGSAKTFPQARPGVLPPLGDPLWPELVPAISAGYGFRVTALEIVQAFGAIANGGELLRPLSAREDGKREVVRRVLSPGAAEKSREILREVVLTGTARGKASSPFYSTAGKTATSYIPDLREWELMHGRKKGNFAGFVGFAPVRSPRLEVYVGILDPRDGDKSGAHGSVHAAPVFRRIIEESLRHLKVEPDRS